MTVVRPAPANAEPVPEETTETIEELFAALESPLLAYALRLVGQRGSAEDITQEAFMRLHRQFAEVRQPRRWLFRTVHNLAINHLRDGNKIVPFDPHGGDSSNPATDTLDPAPLPDEEIARWEGIELVRRSLVALDDRSREVVRLKFIEELSYREIGERTGLESGYVGYLLHHALKTIAAHLARTGLVP
jgi:RNA polymerase sigma-70 factor (ECF subfamily)